jgi:hypothetical protein
MRPTLERCNVIKVCDYFLLPGVNLTINDIGRSHVIGRSKSGKCQVIVRFLSYRTRNLVNTNKKSLRANPDGILSDSSSAPCSSIASDWSLTVLSNVLIWMNCLHIFCSWFSIVFSCLWTISFNGLIWVSTQAWISDSINVEESLYKKMSEWEIRLESQEQYSRRTSLRFHNIKVPVNERGRIIHPVNTDDLILEFTYLLFVVFNRFFLLMDYFF